VLAGSREQRAGSRERGQIAERRLQSAEWEEGEGLPPYRRSAVPLGGCEEGSREQAAGSGNRLQSAEWEEGEGLPAYRPGRG